MTVKEIKFSIGDKIQYWKPYTTYFLMPRQLLIQPTPKEKNSLMAKISKLYIHLTYYLSNVRLSVARVPDGVL